MGRKSLFSSAQRGLGLGMLRALELKGEERAPHLSAFGAEGKAKAFPNNAARSKWFKLFMMFALETTHPELFADMHYTEVEFFVTKFYTEFRLLREQKLELSEDLQCYTAECLNALSNWKVNVLFNVYNQTLNSISIHYLRNRKSGVVPLFFPGGAPPRRMRGIKPLDLNDMSSGLISGEEKKEIGEVTEASTIEIVEDSKGQIKPLDLNDKSSGFFSGEEKKEIGEVTKGSTIEIVEPSEVIEPVVPRRRGRPRKVAIVKAAIRKSNLVGNNYVVSDSNTTWYSDWITRGKFSVLLIVDAASRAILASTCYSHPPRGVDYVKVLQDLFVKYGKPQKIHTDQGGCYVSTVASDFLKEKNVLQSFGVGLQTTFANQAMECINGVITKFLEIQKTKPHFVKEFLSKNFKDKTWLVKAAIADWNSVPITNYAKASPMELYEYLVNQEVRLGIEASQGTKQAWRAELWKDIGETQIEIRKRLVNLEQLGVSRFAEFDSLKSNFELTNASSTHMFEEFKKVLGVFLTMLQSEQKEIQRLIEAQAEISTRRFEEERVARVHSQKLAEEAQRTQEKILAELEETRMQLGDLLRAQEEARRVREKRKAAALARKSRPLRDAFDFKHLTGILNMVDSKCKLANARLRVSLVLLACFGFRVGQLKKFKIGNLRELYTGDGTKIEAIKSRRRQVLELPRAFPVKKWLQHVSSDIEILLKSGKDDDLLNPTSREHQNRQLNSILSRYSESHKVKYNTHSFRIGLITRVTEKEGIDVARRMANHASIATTQLYLRNTLNERKVRSLLRDIIPDPNSGIVQSTAESDSESEDS